MDRVLVIYSIIQSLLFAVVLILGKKNGNKALALYFVHIFLSEVLFSLLTGYFGRSFSDNEGVRVSYEFIALCRPAVIFYFLYSILEKITPWPFHFLWMLPVFNLIIDYTFQAANIDLYNAGFYHNWYFNFPFYTKVLLAVLLVMQIKIFSKEITESSPVKNQHQLIKLYWGKYFTYFLLTMYLCSLSYIAITLANGRLYNFNSSLLIYSPNYYNILYHTFSALFMLMFGYLALRNPSIFNTPSEEVSVEQKIAEIVLPEEEKISLKKIEFSDEQVQKYAAVLTILMENDKIYLDPELSLDKLAKLSAIPSRQLSLFIQTSFNKKYKDYINGFRVLNAQQMLSKPKTSQYTLYAIALESGFNSESSFYKIFKQHTALTPKQYREQVKS